MRIYLKSSLLILLLIIGFAVETAHAQDTSPNQPPIVFDHLTTEDGLSYPEVSSIIQDEMGFIWIATYEGLNRFDGYEFKVYKHDRTDLNSISRNHIYSMALDTQDPDIIWIGTQDGLNKFDRRTETFTRYLNDPNDLNSLAQNNVTHLTQDSDGILWLGTADFGLERFDPVSETFTHYPHNPDDPSSLNNDSILKIFINRDGVV